MALTKVSRGLLSTGIVDNSNATAITLNSDESATFTGTVNAAALTVDTTTLVVDATNNRVGIGTSLPQKNLEIKDATLPVLRLNCGRNETVGSNYALGDIEFFSSDSSGTGARVLASINAIADAASTAPGGHLTFKTAQHNSAALECARFTNAREFLVGTTDTTLFNNSTGGGFSVSSNGFTQIAKQGVDSADPVLILNQTGLDGEVQRFYKDGTIIGSVNCSDGDLAIGTGDCGIRFNNAANAVIPFNITTNSQVDNNLDLGYPTLRWDDIFATNGTINTSDRNEKQDIEELSDAEKRVAVAAKSLLRKYRWKSAVAEKGDNARIHFGIIAQDLQAAFTAEGLDAGRYAMFMSNAWTDEDTGEERTRLGVRYHELLAFIIAAI